MTQNNFETAKSMKQNNETADDDLVGLYKQYDDQSTAKAEPTTTFHNDERNLNSAIQKYQSALKTISSILAKYNNQSTRSNLQTGLSPNNARNSDITTKISNDDNSNFKLAFSKYRIGMKAISNVLSDYNHHNPSGGPHQTLSNEDEQDVSHFKSAYTKYKSGLRALSDIIEKYSNRMAVLDNSFPSIDNSYHANIPKNTQSVGNILNTNSNIDAATIANTIASLYRHNHPEETDTKTNLDNSFYLTNIDSPYRTNHQQSKSSKDVLPLQSPTQNFSPTLKEELKYISNILDKYIKYEDLPPNTLYSKFTSYDDNAHDNFHGSLGGLGNEVSPSNGDKRHYEMVVPNWANPLNKSSPPETFEAQYDDNMKYLKLLQNDMQNSVNQFNQDIIKEQAMNTSGVNTSKTYPLELPDDELDRINPEYNKEYNGNELSKYYNNLKESSKITENITSRYPTDVSPEKAGEISNIDNIDNNTNNIFANISDYPTSALNSSLAYQTDVPSVDVAQIEYYENNGDNNQLYPNITDDNATTYQNNDNNDQRHLDGNVNVKGNMDHLKSLMSQMQQDIDNANTALQDKNQQKLEEKIEEDKTRKGKEDSDSEERNLPANNNNNNNNDNNHNINNSDNSNNNNNNNNNDNNDNDKNSNININYSNHDNNDKNNDINNSDNNDDNDKNNNMNNNDSTNDNKDYSTETYTKDEPGETQYPISRNMKDDFDRVKALISKMQVDIYNTNAAVYSQSHGNKLPERGEEKNKKVKAEKKKQSKATTR